MNTKFSFKFITNGQDDFIDYLKGICIIWIVLTHALSFTCKDHILFDFWGCQAVPLFLLIQVFHCCKHGYKRITDGYKLHKLFRRIIYPFIIIEIAAVILEMALRHDDYLLLFKAFIIQGGLGPGSYYVWIYLELYFLLPVVDHYILRRKNVMIICLLISIALEVLCSYVHMHPFLYRLLFFRYFFLFYLGYIWAKKGVNLNFWTISLSIVSLIFIYIFKYTDLNLEPFFAKSDWKIFHWITYFYVAFLLTWLIRKAFEYTPKRTNRIIRICGKQSYNIFLWQMLVFLYFETNAIIDIILCIFPFIFLEYYKNYKMTKTIQQ